MFHARVLTGAVLIILLTVALWLDLTYFQDSVLLHAIFVIGAFFSFREFWVLCRATGHQTFSIWGTLSGCALVVIHYFCMWLLTHYGDKVRAHQIASDLNNAGLALAILGVFLLTAHRHKFQDSLGGVAVTCMGLLYIYFLPSFVLSLRHMGNDGQLAGPDWNSFGHNLVVATIVLAKGCDVWAYLFGKMLGKHKAFPVLSPGKTIEGLAAGLIGSMLTGMFLSLPAIGVLTHFGPLKSCAIGLCIGIAGIMGDLAESLLKRSAAMKDAGSVVPGFGGALDVVDSLMVAGPVAYFLFPVMM